MGTNIHTYMILNEGDAVKIRGYAGVFEVLKTPPRNGVNVLCRDENNRRWKFGITMASESDEPFALKVDDIVTHLFLGVKVRVKDPRWPGIYVVVAKKNAKIEVAKLGGDNDRYVSCTPNNLELVND
jgi:hypothetical protein